MDTLLTIILVTFILVLSIRAALPARQQPTVIYVQQEPVAAGGQGCLPFVVMLGVVLVVFTLISAR
jgi:hypothetical protein